MQVSWGRRRWGRSGRGEQAVDELERVSFLVFLPTSYYIHVGRWAHKLHNIHTGFSIAASTQLFSARQGDIDSESWGMRRCGMYEGCRLVLVYRLSACLRSVPRYLLVSRTGRKHSWRGAYVVQRGGVSPLGNNCASPGRQFHRICEQVSRHCFTRCKIGDTMWYVLPSWL